MRSHSCLLGMFLRFSLEEQNSRSFYLSTCVILSDVLFVFNPKVFGTEEWNRKKVPASLGVVQYPFQSDL